MAQGSDGKVQVVTLDVRNYSSYAGVVDLVSGVVGDDGLSGLINNAGIYNKVDLLTGDPQLMVENFEVNAVTPLMLTRAFLPLLQKAAAGGSSPVVANVTSKMGSMSDNTSGGHYAYRGSKAALNMISQSLSHDLAPHGIMVVSLHPGWVLTDMGGPHALITPATSIAGMIQTIEKTSRGEVKNHIFRNYDGSEISW